MKSSIVLSKGKINSAEALMMIDSSGSCMHLNHRDLGSVGCCICFLCNGGDVVCPPKGMVFKMKNFSNDGDKLDLAIK